MKTACNSNKAMSSNQPHSDDAQNPRKPNHDAQELLRCQMQQAVLLYGSGNSHSSLQKIADELALNPIKVRKLLITAGVYRSDTAARVNERFSAYQQEGIPHKDAIAFTARDMQLSTFSVASYIPQRPLITDISNNAFLCAERPHSGSTAAKQAASPFVGVLALSIQVSLRYIAVFVRLPCMSAALASIP